MLSNAKKYHLNFKNSVKRWDEAIPLGNGQLGCLIFGDAKPLIFSLDRVDIWDTTRNPDTLKSDFTYSNLINLVNGGKKNQAEIVRRFDDIYNHPTPTKLPVGHIELVFKDSFQNINSSLNLYGAICNISFSDVAIESFIHSLSPIGIIKINGEVPTINLVPPKFKDENYIPPKDAHGKVFSNQLSALGYDNATHYQKDNTFWFIQKTKCALEYGIFYSVKQVENGVIIAYSVATNSDDYKNGKNWVENATFLVENALKQEYDNLKSSHEADWKKFYNSSDINIPDKVLEKAWYENNYLLNSCSREGFYPTPLQGVWTADNGFLPPWKGDYHHDLNTQMSYYSYLKANMPLNGKCFIDYLWRNKNKAEEFAKSFFDANGILYPTVSAINGAPLGGWPQYSLNLVNNIWLAEAFDNYYEYFGDEEFLTTRAYPYFEGVANGVIRWLKKDKNGKYKLPLSSSPEVFDNNFEAWQKPNTTNDLTLLIYLFSTLAKYSTTLKNGKENLWQSYLRDLDSLPLDDNGAIMMNGDSPLVESHRHLGHLMSIYPLHTLSYDTAEGKKIIDASVNQLEKLGDGQSCCFTYSWKAALYAIQRNGNAAWRYLRIFTDYIMSQNGFNLNFDYKNYGLHFWHERPFTLESNFGFNAVLQETLLFSEKDTIRVFPAIPDCFNGNASFNNFRTQRGVLVSSKITNNSLEYIKLSSQKTVSKKIYNSFNTSTLSIIKNKSVTCINCKIGDCFELRFIGKIEIIPAY